MCHISHQGQQKHKVFTKPHDKYSEILDEIQTLIKVWGSLIATANFLLLPKFLSQHHLSTDSLEL